MNAPETFLVLLLALGLSACGPKQGGPAGPPGGFSIPVETVPALQEPVQDKLAVVGTLEPNELVQIKAETAGTIQKITLDEGARVQAGAVLFQIDDEKLKAELEAAEARLEQARNNLERSRSLLGQKAISPQEADDAQAAFKAANATVTLARERLQDATIRSPIDGRLRERLVSPGKFVDVGETLISVVQSDPLKVDFAVPERYLGQLAIGQQVQVKVAALPGKVFTGEVYFIDPRVDPTTRTVKVKARLANPNEELRSGLFGNIELVLGTRPAAVTIPEQAIVPQIDKLSVFVVENGLARRREVTVGARLPGKVEIASGLSAGEQVVVAGQQKLRDSVPVQPLPPQGATPAPAQP